MLRKWFLEPIVFFPNFAEMGGGKPDFGKVQKKSRFSKMRRSLLPWWRWGRTWRWSFHQCWCWEHEECAGSLEEQPATSWNCFKTSIWNIQTRSRRFRKIFSSILSRGIQDDSVTREDIYSFSSLLILALGLVTLIASWAALSTKAFLKTK